MLSPVGHKNYNFNLLNIIVENCDVDTVFESGYLNDFEGINNKINRSYDIPEKYLPKSISNKKGLIYKVLYRYNLYKAVKWVGKLVKKNDYDLILFTGIDIISFSLATKRVVKRYVFVDHAITYLDKNKVKRYFWQHLNPKIQAIAMEEYIKVYLKENLKVKNKVWILKHPLPTIKKYNNTAKENKIIFAPSGSNDEDFVSYLIENSDRIKGYKIIIKSKKQSINLKKLEVYNKRITNEEYYNLMSNCDYILLPYNSNYNYRVSGVFFEAVVFNKRCIISSNNTLKYYADKYPKTVLKYDNYSDFIGMLESLKTGSNNNTSEELNLIKKNYSSHTLTEQLKLILSDGEKLND
ncbi:hypothetical protein WMZ97_12435 [Lentibacillus sp. N15]|uniref:hypothetical protein n=1 Tax=Lentibacillus songyuanensis TaxID=3136161 RepID=UPI0031BAA687